jgi:hypothetical protein
MRPTAYVTAALRCAKRCSANTKLPYRTLENTRYLHEVAAEWLEELHRASRLRRAVTRLRAMYVPTPAKESLA